jgi:hypothetical protein
LSRWLLGARGTGLLTTAGRFRARRRATTSRVAGLGHAGDRRISTDLEPYLEHSNARYHLGHESSADLWDFLLTAEEFRVPAFAGLDPSASMEVWKLAQAERERQTQGIGDH